MMGSGSDPGRPNGLFLVKHLIKLHTVVYNITTEGSWVHRGPFKRLGWCVSMGGNHFSANFKTQQLILLSRTFVSSASSGRIEFLCHQVSSTQTSPPPPPPPPPRPRARNTNA